MNEINLEPFDRRGSLETTLHFSSESEWQQISTKLNEIFQSLDTTLRANKLIDNNLSNDFPTWFIKEFSNTRTLEEEKEYLIKYRSLSTSERVKLEENRSWDFPNWVSWLEPEDRPWVSLHARLLTNEKFELLVTSDSLPIATGSIRWLLKCVGAKNITEL